MEQQNDKIHVSYQESEFEPIIERQNNPTDVSLSFDNQLTAERYFEEELNGNPHFSPGSVLIAIIGTDFPEGCKEKIKAMYLYAREAGYNVKYIEMQVYHNTFPQASHASTRNHAINSGRIGGTDYICFLDTDVEPTEDMLVKLLAHKSSIITPYVIDPALNRQLGGPTRQKDSGVYNQKWIAQCFMLIKTAVFNNTEIHFAYDEAEDMFSQRIHLYGINQQVDTSQILTLASPPGRPDSQLWDTRMDKLKERYNREPRRNLTSEEEYRETEVKNEIISMLTGQEEDSTLILRRPKVTEQQEQGND